jgi:hypothetical protein
MTIAWTIQQDPILDVWQSTTMNAIYLSLGLGDSVHNDSIPGFALDNYEQLVMLLPCLAGTAVENAHSLQGD